MFTGIVEERGTVLDVGEPRLVVGCRTVARDSSIGSSVAVNGVCLTVVERADDRLGFDLSPETRSRTSLARLRGGDPVNLERPLTLASRLGGHLVQGHVDGVGTIEDVEPNEAGAALRVRPPAGVLPYIVEKGSISVDGVSLTVSALVDGAFEVALIPHTLVATTLGSARPGDPVNLEADIVAKYVERILTPHRGERS